MSISVAPVMEFIRESDEIQIDFHTQMYIVKGCFDILVRIIESTPSKIGAFSKYTVNFKSRIFISCFQKQTF